MFGRNKTAALAAEFLGTGALTLLVLSVQRSTIGVPFFVAAAAGLAVALMTFTVGNTSGGYFNPALTIAMWTARKLALVPAIAYIIVQFLGAWLAYYLYTYYVNNGLTNVGGHFTLRIMIAEAVGTFIFAFGFAAATYRQTVTEGSNAAFKGLALMLGVIAASSASIGLLNPAVALGVRAFVPGTYIAGPILGALVGVNLYAILFAAPATETAVASTRVVAPTVTAKKPVAKKKPVTKKK